MTLLVNIVVSRPGAGNVADVRLTDPGMLPARGDRVSIDGISGEVVARCFHLTPYFTEVEIVVSEVADQ